MTKAEELLCNIFQCGQDDLQYLYDLKADYFQILALNGNTDFNETFRVAFEDKVGELFGLDALEDMTIEPNYRATEMYIANRDKYDEEKIKKLEEYMGLEFRDIEG